MTETFSIFSNRSAKANLGDEALCLVLGAGLTVALFTGIARFENVRPGTPHQEIEDLRSVSAIFEPPPPKVEEHPEQVDVVPPLTGLDIGHSESQVKLAVVPPDLDKIIPPTELPPQATIQFSQMFSDLKPKAGISGDFEHIYQQSEVDQVPNAITKTIARVPSRVRDDADQLRVTLLLVIDTEGVVSSIRVLKASGNEKFDKIVLECVRDEWEFTPAIRKGKKVRCMVQQLVWYKWTEGSKFTL
jgi:TonB family protein